MKAVEYLTDQDKEKVIDACQTLYDIFEDEYYNYATKVIPEGDFFEALQRYYAEIGLSKAIYEIMHDLKMWC